MRLTCPPTGLAVLLVLLILPGAAQGDGCVIDRLGRYVPEQEQLAFIEWQDGRERLYVATRTAPTDQPSLWIVPVRSNPEHVRAEPVETAPQAVYYQPTVKRAQDRLREALVMVAALDTGLGPCAAIPFVGFGCPASGPGPGDVTEYQRVEKLGMVVVVLTAKSVEAFDDYLAANGVAAKAGDLTAVTPYVGRDDAAFVCAWLARGGQALAARAVRIDFPTPVVFYPLQPTRVYDEAVKTVVYVRGFVRPTADLAVPGVECRYVRGSVKEVNLGYSFAPPKRSHYGYLTPPPPDATLEPLTRVEVTSLPSAWTSDLVLEAGAPAAVQVAEVVGGAGLWLPWVTSAGLGVMLALILPWVVVPREVRGWADWLWAAAVGAATGLTLWASLLLFIAWMAQNFSAVPPGRFSRILGKSVLIMAGAGFALSLVGCGLRLGSGVDLAVVVFIYPGLLLLALCWPTTLLYLLTRVARYQAPDKDGNDKPRYPAISVGPPGRMARGGWIRAAAFVLFILTHWGAASLVFSSLLWWVSAYE